MASPQQVSQSTLSKEHVGLTKQVKLTIYCQRARLLHVQGDSVAMLYGEGAGVMVVAAPAPKSLAGWM